MFVKLNSRVYINLEKITKIRVEDVEDDIRVRFYEGSLQVGKSCKFKSVKDADKWIAKIIK